MRRTCAEGCTCGLHQPSEQRNARISIGLELHWAAVGVSDDPTATRKREWRRRNRTRVNARRKARRDSSR